MTLSHFKSLSRRGHLVRQIINEEWPMRLGDWRAVDERCELLADTAPSPAGISKWEGQAVRGLLYREGLIGYDLDSGLWYCLVVAPKQDYPVGWESEAKMERKKRLAEREAMALVNPPRQKAKRKPKADSGPANGPRSDDYIR